MAEDNQFDIIGALISEEGKIGENLATQIFSLLDISSLVRVRRVSRTWNQFLKKQKSIWMEKLRRTEDFLGHLDWELFSGRKRLNNPYNQGKEICNRQCFALTSVLSAQKLLVQYIHIHIFIFIFGFDFYFRLHF